MDIKHIIILLFILIYVSCKEYNTCIQYPEQVRKQKLEILYEKAILDFYFSNSHVIYFKKKLLNEETIVDSSISVRLLECKIKLDSINEHESTVIFYFSFYNGTEKVIQREWAGDVTHSIGLEYNKSNSKLVKEIGIGYSTYGTNYDKLFRDRIFNPKSIKYLKANRVKFNIEIQCLINKHYPEIFDNLKRN